MSNSSNTLSLKLNVHCKICGVKLKKRLQKIKGVHSVEIDQELGKVVISGIVNSAKVLKKLENWGTEAQLWPCEQLIVNDPMNNSDIVTQLGQLSDIPRLHTVETTVTTRLTFQGEPTSNNPQIAQSEVISHGGGGSGGGSHGSGDGYGHGHGSGGHGNGGGGYGSGGSGYGGGGHGHGSGGYGGGHGNGGRGSYSGGGGGGHGSGGGGYSSGGHGIGGGGYGGDGHGSGIGGGGRGSGGYGDGGGRGSGGYGDGGGGGSHVIDGGRGYGSGGGGSGGGSHGSGGGGGYGGGGGGYGSGDGGSSRGAHGNGCGGLCSASSSRFGGHGVNYPGSYYANNGNDYSYPMENMYTLDPSVVPLQQSSGRPNPSAPLMPLDNFNQAPPPSPPAFSSVPPPYYSFLSDEYANGCIIL